MKIADLAKLASLAEDLGIEYYILADGGIVHIENTKKKKSVLPLENLIYSFSNYLVISKDGDDNAAFAAIAIGMGCRYNTNTDEEVSFIVSPIVDGTLAGTQEIVDFIDESVTIVDEEAREIAIEFPLFPNDSDASDLKYEVHMVLSELVFKNIKHCKENKTALTSSSFAEHRSKLKYNLDRYITIMDVIQKRFKTVDEKFGDGVIDTIAITATPEYYASISELIRNYGFSVGVSTMDDKFTNFMITRKIGKHLPGSDFSNLFGNLFSF